MEVLSPLLLQLLLPYCTPLTKSESDVQDVGSQTKSDSLRASFKRVSRSTTPPPTTK